MPYAVDLHTHSVVSPDGALTPEDYQRMLRSGQLQYIAVTDHNTIDGALQLRHQFGSAIIIGEEISTDEGEVIGLYLSQTISRQPTAMDAVRAIKDQGGLVYIPHPFETIRKGIQAAILERLASHVDIIEVHNGRALFQNKSNRARAWGKTHHVPGAASSDAHGRTGWGKTASILSEPPSRENLVELLTVASLRHGFVGVRGIMYPKVNRFRKRFGNV